MATYKSDIITAKDSLDVSSKSLSGEKTGAPVLYATADYVFGNPRATNGDVLDLADIPAGATVVPELSYVSKSFGGRHLRILLGDKHAGGRFGQVGTDSSGIPEGPHGFGYDSPSTASFGYEMQGSLSRYTETTRVKATLSNISLAIPENEKLRFGIAYRVQG
ncbi:MAG: hypothetical protein KF712_04485 [Akkermansiaceae bacterium]|nr:hypothetical protein [Akkermansiaceae bacterium]